MKLIAIELKNIGPYKNNKIEFNTNAKKNVVLICGENGAGKTTMLKSIKLGLFGSFLYGLKQQSKSNTYLSEVKSIIKNNETWASISLRFSIVEDYVETIYDLKRFWTLEPFKESVQLFVNSTLVSNEEFLNKMEYINRYFSPKLIDAMMFDGEKIINYIDEDIFNDYVKENIIYSFGLNYYLDLIDDLDKYIASEHKKNNLTVEQLRLNELENKWKNDKKEISVLEDKVKTLIEMYEKSQFELDLKVEEFSNLGGMDSGELEELSTLLKDMETNRSKQMIRMREFFENNICYKINDKILIETKKKILDEKPVRFTSYLNEMIDSNLLKQNAIQTLKAISEQINEKNVNPIIFASKNEEECFDEIEEKIKESKALYDDIDTRIKIDDTLISNIRKQIDHSKSEEVNDILNEIEVITKKKDEISIEIKKSEELIKNKTIINERLFEELNELKNKVFEQSKNSDSFVLANKYKDVCISYYNSEVSKIVEKVSKLATSLLNKTYRKKGYISDLYIDSNFVVEAFLDKDKKNLKQLSAGEKQIFVAAVLVAIIKLSGRNIPLVFDTPAGRLDNEHMSNFFEKIMAYAGNQVIIMPTSKEINDDVLSKIKNRLAGCYTLEYQTNGSTEIIKNKIFEREWK